MTWYNASYQYKKSIVIDHTKVITADQSNFPLLVSMVDADLKVAGSGGKVQNSSGFDIIFVDSTETTKLDHEIEKYVSTTGEIEMHIRIPNASHTVDTTIYMYFDNSSISTSQENKTGVWDSNFKGVWHFNDNAANTTVKDSTSNVNNGTARVNTSTKTVAGKIGSGLAFNGTSDYIDVPSQAGSNFTISAWVATTQVANTQSIVGQISSTGSDCAYLFRVKSSGGFFSAHNVSQFITCSPTFVSGVFAHCVMTYNGSTLIFYFNGASFSSGAATGTPETITDHFYIGVQGTQLVNYFIGNLDEVRFSNVARSAGWIATEYNNQNSPSTFYTVGSLTSAPLTATKKISSRLYQMAQSARTISSRLYQFSQNQRIVKTRVSQFSIAIKRLQTRVYQFSQASKKTITRLYQYAKIQKSIPSRVYQYIKAQRQVVSRFYQYAASNRDFPARLGQFVSMARKYPSRISQFGKSNRSITGRFYQYLVARNKIVVSRFGQFSHTAQKYLSRISQFGQSRQVVATRLFQQSVTQKRIVSRYFQFVTHKQSIVSRIRQFGQARSGISSRLFSYGLSLRNISSRFGQMARTIALFPSRFFQFDTKIRAVSSRLVFILQSPRNVMSRLSHYANRSRLIISRVGIYGRSAQNVVSRLSSHDRQMRLFPMRIGQRDQAQRIILARISMMVRSSVPFSSRISQLDVTKRVVPSRLFSFGSQKRTLPSRLFLQNSTSQMVHSRFVHILVPIMWRMCPSRVSQFDRRGRVVTCRLRLVEPTFIAPIVMQAIGRDGIGTSRGRDGIARVGGIA